MSSDRLERMEIRFKHGDKDYAAGLELRGDEAHDTKVKMIEALVHATLRKLAFLDGDVDGQTGELNDGKVRLVAKIDSISKTMVGI